MQPTKHLDRSNLSLLQIELTLRPCLQQSEYASIYIDPDYMVFTQGKIYLEQHPSFMNCKIEPLQLTVKASQIFAW